MQYPKLLLIPFAIDTFLTIVGILEVFFRGISFRGIFILSFSAMRMYCRVVPKVIR